MTAVVAVVEMLRSSKRPRRRHRLTSCSRSRDVVVVAAVGFDGGGDGCGGLSTSLGYRPSLMPTLMSLRLVVFRRIFNSFKIG